MTLGGANDDGVNPYASPLEVGGLVPDQSPDGLWREGKWLVMHREGTLPDRCIRCNAPANGYRLKRKLSWCYPAWHLFLVCNLLIWILVVVAVSKRATIQVGLCELHRRRRRRLIASGWLLALAGLGCFVLVIDVRSEPAVAGGLFGGIVLLIAGIVLAGIVSPPVTVRKMDKTYLWLKRVSPELLNELPTLVR